MLKLLLPDLIKFSNSVCLLNQNSSEMMATSDKKCPTLDLSTSETDTATIPSSSVSEITLGDIASNTPILFVHGNGDSSALWMTTLWRFESNGYPADRLFTIDFPHPQARDDNTKPQINRSGTDEQLAQLSERVQEVLSQTNASKLILIGNSRGGNSIRNFIKNGNGADKVLVAILCGTPNHGAIKVPLNNNFEFNGDGPFLKGLNSGPDEVVQGVSFMTIRSDKNDKFAQPPSIMNPFAVGYDGPALKGAYNVVLDNVDHRETAYSPQAFAEMFKFITGSYPSTLNIIPEDAPILSGMITGFENDYATNLPVVDALVSVYEIDSQTGQRIGDAVYQATTGVDGSWGSFTSDPNAYYEFVVDAPDTWSRHFFRSPFPRSSKLVTMRLYNDKPADGDDVAVVFTRPRGYFAKNRDFTSLDGKPLPGVHDGVPTVSNLRIEFEGPGRPMTAILNDETITLRTIPGAVVYAEFTQ